MRRPAFPRARTSDASGERLSALEARLQALEAGQAAATAELRSAIEQSRQHLLSAIQVAIDDEPRTRRAVQAWRTSADYARAFEAADPLVSVVIPTYTNAEGLARRSVPSALAQTHANVEVIVVGDASPPEVEAALTGLGDKRVRYERLNRRGPYPEDRDGLWFTAGTGPLNRAMELARGEWIAVLNDDDAFRPDHVERLLALAREQRCEVAYGKLAYHQPDGSSHTIGEFPPAHHQFGWQMALQHGGLRMFEYELSTHLFGEPGDWNRARRMLRTGVRFEFLDEVVGDYWPGRLWSDAG